jgi:arsenate reductase
MTTIYHNPRCSKSRASLEMLEAKGINPTIIKYLDTPPDKAELTEILDKLGLQAEQIVRKGEALFTELGLNDKSLSNQEWIEVLAQNPRLMERPIVVSGNKAAIGRPIERVIDILKPQHNPDDE